MLILGDCLEQLKTLPADYIDAVVTDPPYGLVQNKKGGSGTASIDLDSPYGRSRIGSGNGPGGFMGMKWDSSVPSVDVWREVLRVLKPGGHVLSFGGTRTYHRMVVNVEDAGLEVRDQLQWNFGSGFPKSHNLKRDWQGWGTALKPANEPIVLARKPLSEKTVALNVQKWGTGALNIDGCRIATDDKMQSGRHIQANRTYPSGYKDTNRTEYEQNSQGRWPANLILDERAAEMLGEPSRFFYVAKASKRERNAGLEGMPLVPGKTMGERNPDTSGASNNTTGQKPALNQNFHPTVKPIKLMEYLITLVTPPMGIVLDPFMGSGSTGVAAHNLGFGFIGIDMNEEYLEIAKRRIEHAKGIAA